MKEIWSAISPTLASTKGKSILISTPKGQAGFYYNTYMNAKALGFHIIDAHWSRHPNYSKGQYQWIQNGDDEGEGHLKFYNEEWPDTIFDKDTGTYIELDKTSYPFICDGKIRSPWYDLESTKLGPRLTKCELDCNFAGTGGEVLDSDLLRELKLYAEANSYKNPFDKLKGIYRNYKEYKEYNPAHKYVLSSDVATGDGSDWSTFTVIDLTDFEICATYKEQLMPDAFAQIIHKVGTRFGNCIAVIENAGGGGTTLQTLKVKGYPSIYYSTLQKKDPSTGMKKRKIGLWPSEDVRWQGGDKLEAEIRLRNLLIPCTQLVEELNTWIWDKDGKRRHAPQKNDDLIMALQHGVWYAYYVFKRSERNKTGFKNIFERDTNGKSITMTDALHGRGTIVNNSTRYVLEKRSTSTISGSIDKMIDARILSNSELRERRKNEQKGGRQMFI